MNVTLDTFRRHFLNIAVFAAVFITVLIGLSFINELRERSGIAFGNLPKTELLGEPFAKEFTFSLEKPKMQKSAKVALIKIENSNSTQAKSIAEKLKIKGKVQSFKDSLGNLLVKIEDRSGSLSYNLKDQSWNFTSLKKEDKPKTGFGIKEAEIAAGTLAKRLNLTDGLEIFRVQMLAGSSTHLSPTQNEKEARQFEISFTQKTFDSLSLNQGYAGVFTVIFDKSATLVKASFNPTSIDLENVGTYPLINLGGIEKRLRSGQGKIVYSDSEELTANLSRVDKIDFTDIKLVYFSDEENGIIAPFWVLEGRTDVGGKGAHLTVAVNAIVDRYLME